eukprot:10452238-Ditylum_brightwellii.AAC.1
MQQYDHIRQLPWVWGKGGRTSNNKGSVILHGSGAGGGLEGVKEGKGAQVAGVVNDNGPGLLPTCLIGDAKHMHALHWWEWEEGQHIGDCIAAIP